MKVDPCIPSGEKIDHQEKNEIVSEIYKRDTVRLHAVAARFGIGKMDRQSVIHDFFIAKICSRSIDKLRQDREGPSGKIIGWFKNFLKESYGKNKRRREKKDNYKETLIVTGQAYAQIEEIDINDRITIVIERYRALIEKRFNKPYYPEVFDLMIKEYSDEVIAERLKQNRATIATARHRIREFLRTKISH